MKKMRVSLLASLLLHVVILVSLSLVVEKQKGEGDSTDRSEQAAINGGASLGSVEVSLVEQPPGSPEPTGEIVPKPQEQKEEPKAISKEQLAEILKIFEQAATFDPDNIPTPQIVPDSPMNCDEANSFGGIGINENLLDSKVTYVAPGYPADRYGMKVGDIIKDSRSAQGSNIRGPEGSTVVITVFRPSTNQTLVLTIVRDRICTGRIK